MWFMKPVSHRASGSIELQGQLFFLTFPRLHLQCAQDSGDACLLSVSAPTDWSLLSLSSASCVSLVSLEESNGPM